MNTILEQLGGNKFLAMTGARNLVAIDRGLMFSLPRGAKNGANKVRITLNATDTYDIEFFAIRSTNVIDCGYASFVYADQLRGVFTRETGFDCTL